jgi:hypothetical protein
MYLQKLAAQGVLIFNISNSHVDLRPILAAIANQLHLTALCYDGGVVRTLLEYPSTWVVMTKNESLSAKLQNDSEWKMLADTQPNLVWTDDYSNILRVLK